MTNTTRTRLARRLRKLGGGALVRRSLVLVSGTAIGQLAVVAASPLLSRLYDASEIGVLAVFLSLVGLGTVVSSLRYEQAIALPDDDRTSGRVVVLAGLVTLATSAAVGVAAIVGGSWLEDVTSTPGLGRLIWLLPAVLCLAGLFQVLMYWDIRRVELRPVAAGRAGQGLTLAIGQVALAAVLTGADGLIVGLLLSWVVALTLIALPARAQARGWWHDLTWSRLAASARRYRRFPLFGVWSGLFNRGALDVPGIALAAIYGPKVAGYFLLAQRVVAAPVQLVGQSVGHVYLGEAAKRMRGLPATVYELYHRTWKRLLLIGILPTLVLLVFGPSLFALVFGDAWREAGQYAQLLSLSFLAQLVITPLTSTFAITERQDLQFYRDALRLLGVVSVFVLAAALDLSARWAVFGYGAVMLVGYLALFWLGAREVAARRSAPS